MNSSQEVSPSEFCGTYFWVKTCYLAINPEEILPVLRCQKGFNGYYTTWRELVLKCVPPYLFSAPKEEDRVLAKQSNRETSFSCLIASDQVCTQLSIPWWDRKPSTFTLTAWDAVACLKNNWQETGRILVCLNAEIAAVQYCCSKQCTSLLYKSAYSTLGNSLCFWFSFSPPPHSVHSGGAR